VSKEAEKILAIELEQAKCTETSLIRELEQEKAGVKRTQKLLEEAKGEVKAMSNKINVLSTSLSAIIANVSDYRTYTSSSIDQLFSVLGDIDQGRKSDVGSNHDTLFEKIQAV
jgi:predicted  nucleic acid-binding Zn-ribbon protein